MPDNRNFILAIGLSLAVLIGWSYFVSGPQIERARQEQTVEQTAPTTAEGAELATQDGIALPGRNSAAVGPAGDLPTETAAGSADREAALAANPRVPIASDLVSGSINLRGARLDDLKLNTYRETVDPDSENITLFSPSGGSDAYFAELGWQAADSGSGEVPDGATIWSAPAGARLTPATPVTLTFDNGTGLVFNRTIALDDAYMFTITDSIANKSDVAADLSAYGRLTRLGEPDVAGFWILHEGMIGVLGDEGLEQEKYGSIEDDGTKSFADVSSGWLGITDKYWAAVLIPEKGSTFDARYVFSGTDTPTYQADFRQAPVLITPGDTVEVTTRLFAGAKVVAIVDGYADTYEIELFDRLIDWGWFFFITKPLFSLIDFFFNLFGNFGVAILAVTVIIKAAFFPLASKSYKSMSAMRRLQPQMTKLREQFKDDKAKQQQALMALYKTEKINPLAGCWPIAIQIPVFFALYKVLFVTIEMRHAPFFGWIQDLAAPDPTTIFNLFGLIPWDPPSLMLVGVWPLVMGVTMFVQMKLNPTPPDPTQAMIFTWMPVVFTFMLASFPAGLVIYWAWNNSLSVTQQYVIMRREGVVVDLLGNIISTFRKTKNAVAAAAPAAATATAGDSVADTETVAAEPVAEAEPVDPSRKVRPKKAPKRAKTRGRNGNKTKSTSRPPRMPRDQ